MLKAIVVTYLSESTIDSCISSALESGIDQVIVWDNSPGLSTIRHLQSMNYGAEVSLHGDYQNLGFGGTINRAVDMFVDESDLILLLNPDCILNRACVESIALCANDPSTGLVAPRMQYPNGSFGYAGGAAPKLGKELLALTNLDKYLPKSMRDLLVRMITARRGSADYGETMSSGRPLRVDWVSGFCVAVRAEVFRATGGFDSHFFLYFEDVDLSLRAKSLGYHNIVDRRVQALHFESQSTGPTGKSKHYRAGMWAYFEKWGNAPERILAGIARGKRKLEQHGT